MTTRKTNIKNLKHTFRADANRYNYKVFYSVELEPRIRTLTLNNKSHT